MPEHTETPKAYDCPILIKQKKLKKKKTVIETGTDYECHKAKDYLTQQHRKSKNSSITTKITASEQSCKVLCQQNPLTMTDTDCGRQPKTKTGQKTSPLRTSQGTSARSNVKNAHAFAEQLAEVFHLHPSENKPEEGEAIIQLQEAPYQLEPPTTHVKRAEVQEFIRILTPKKSNCTFCTIESRSNHPHLEARET
jgi:hypothetical protein